MSQRNYPCDSLVVAFFNTSSGELNAVGEPAFKKQLWCCMAAMALTVKAQIEHYRSQNTLGLLVWQLNEIWPVSTVSHMKLLALLRVLDIGARAECLICTDWWLGIS